MTAVEPPVSAPSVVPAERPALSRRQLIAALAAPALLLAVTAVHGYLRAQHDLFPWRGGGFAMFSTLERRVAIAHVFEEGGTSCALTRGNLNLPKRVRSNVTQVTGLPTASSLEGVLDDFLDDRLAFSWIADERGRRLLTGRDRAQSSRSEETEAAQTSQPGPEPEREAPASITGARIDVWSGTPGPLDCAEHGFAQQPCIVYERLQSASRSR